MRSFAVSGAFKTKLHNCMWVRYSLQLHAVDLVIENTSLVAPNVGKFQTAPLSSRCVWVCVQKSHTAADFPTHSYISPTAAADMTGKESIYIAV